MKGKHFSYIFLAISLFSLVYAAITKEPGLFYILGICALAVLGRFVIYCFVNHEKTIINIPSFKVRPYFATIEIFKIVTTEKQFKTVFGICLHRGFLRKNLYVDLADSSKRLKKTHKDFYNTCATSDYKKCLKIYRKLYYKNEVR